MEKTVLIVGLGLIGSSIALDIKQVHPQVQIIGLDTDRESLAIAKRQGIIDQIGETLPTEAPVADFIILCTPVKAAIRQLTELSELPLKPGVIITDVGSTKSEIMTKVRTLAPDFPFVGGHPMAGSHKSGVLAADKDLFENAYYILTPKTDADEDLVEQLEALLHGTRAKFVVLSAEEHDQITGMLSHLPHVIASGLVNQSKKFTQTYPRAQQLAAGGFRDITRIASSDPRMWTDVLLSNQAPILSQLDSWQEEMQAIRAAIAAGDRQAIFEFFVEAKETRDTLPVHEKGAIPAFYDLFVDVPDYPGVIAEVTGYLAEEEISLINVKIIETREDIFGILQLTFKNLRELERARECIERRSTYRCYEK